MVFKLGLSCMERLSRGRCWRVLKGKVVDLGRENLDFLGRGGGVYWL